jgi:hypothetical protein
MLVLLAVFADAVEQVFEAVGDVLPAERLRGVVRLG